MSSLAAWALGDVIVRKHILIEGGGVGAGRDAQSHGAQIDLTYSAINAL